MYMRTELLKYFVDWCNKLYSMSLPSLLMVIDWGELAVSVIFLVGKVCRQTLSKDYRNVRVHVP